jgi:hypothetical protein
MRARRKRVPGGDPPEDIEPTTDQIAAIEMRNHFNWAQGSTSQYSDLAAAEL